MTNPGELQATALEPGMGRSEDPNGRCVFFCVLRARHSREREPGAHSHPCGSTAATIRLAAAERVIASGVPPLVDLLLAGRSGCVARGRVVGRSAAAGRAAARFVACGARALVAPCACARGAPPPPSPSLPSPSPALLPPPLSWPMLRLVPPFAAAVGGPINHYLCGARVVPCVGSV